MISELMKAISETEQTGSEQLRKSQMAFDFSRPLPPPKHTEERTIHGSTRHLITGATVIVKQHTRKTEIVDHSGGSALPVGEKKTQEATMANIPLIKQTFRDEHNALRSRMLLIINGKQYLPTYTHSVWGKRTLRPAGVKWSHLDSVVTVNGQQYRMGEKVARPLKLSDGEKLMPADWNSGKMYVSDEVAQEQGWMDTTAPEPQPEPKPDIPKNPKTGPQRVAVLMSMAPQLEGLQEYHDDIQACTNRKELEALERTKYDRLPWLAGSTIRIGDLEPYWIVADMGDIKERELSKAAKLAETTRKEAIREGKDRVVREAKEQTQAFAGKNPELIAAIEGHKPQMVEDFTQSAHSVLEHLTKIFGPQLKGSSKSKGATAQLQSYGQCFKHTTEGWEIDEAATAVEAQRNADATAEHWLHKISSKMTEMEAATVHHMDGSDFAISGTVQGKKVRIIQSWVAGHSMYGVPYYQYPARIYVEGKFTPELEYKRLIGHQK